MNFDFKIELLIGDSKANKQSAMAETYRHVQQGSIGFIGPSTSSSTIQVSRVLSVPSIDRAVIGYSATSAILSDSAFSNFVRTVPSDDAPAKAMAKFITGVLASCLILFGHTMK